MHRKTRACKELPCFPPPSPLCAPIPSGHPWRQSGFGNSNANWRQVMSEVLDLVAEVRKRAGKEASPAIRREGRVPAVIYGEKQEPASIHIEEKVLMKALHTGHFFNSVVMLDVGGKKVRTLPKDVQFHPVTDRP